MEDRDYSKLVVQIDVGFSIGPSDCSLLTANDVAFRQWQREVYIFCLKFLFINYCLIENDLWFTL